MFYNSPCSFDGVPKRQIQEAVEISKRRHKTSKHWDKCTQGRGYTNLPIVEGFCNP